MEYEKMAHLLDSASNKLSKFRTRNLVEINDNIRSTYSPNKQIRFKTAMVRSSLCDYSDAYLLKEMYQLVTQEQPQYQLIEIKK